MSASVCRYFAGHHFDEQYSFGLIVRIILCNGTLCLLATVKIICIICNCNYTSAVNHYLIRISMSNFKKKSFIFLFNWQHKKQKKTFFKIFKTVLFNKSFVFLGFKIKHATDLLCEFIFSSYSF